MWFIGNLILFIAFFGAAYVNTVKKDAATKNEELYEWISAHPTFYPLPETILLEYLFRAI